MEIKLKLSKKQSQFIYDLQSKMYQYMLYGGGIKGAKTWLGAIIFLNFAYNQPNTRYGIFRKERSVLKRTTYKVFKKAAARYNFKFRENQSDLVWYFENGSEIHFLEADIGKDPDLNKLRGLDLTAAMVDECNEVSEQVFNTLMGRVGTVNFNKEFPLIYMTCNPSQTWVKERFYDKWEDNTLEAPYYFMQALPQDNPWNPPEYLKSLTHMPEREYRTYVLGDWHHAESPDQLITYRWIKNCIDNQQLKKAKRIVIGCDPAWLGNDKTAIAVMQDNVLTDMKIITKNRTDVIAEKIINLSKELNVGYEDIGIDSVGIGAGVVDHLWSKDMKVRAVNVGKSATQKSGHFTFRNLRAQIFWQLREDLENNNIILWDKPYLRELTNELLQIKYDVPEKQIIIEPKKEAKKRLGHSPDLADALAICNFVRNNQSQPSYLGTKQTLGKEYKDSDLIGINIDNVLTKLF